MISAPNSWHISASVIHAGDALKKKPGCRRPDSFAIHPGVCQPSFLDSNPFDAQSSDSSLRSTSRTIKTLVAAIFTADTLCAPSVLYYGMSSSVPPTSITKGISSCIFSGLMTGWSEPPSLYVPISPLHQPQLNPSTADLIRPWPSTTCLAQFLPTIGPR